MNILLKSPLKDLARIHPAAAALSVFDDSDPRFDAILADVRTRGIVQPLTIDSEDRVVLGVNHWRAARALRLEEVPCLVVPDGDATTLLIADLMHRAHLTKSARAYLIYPLLKEAHEEARQRAVQNLKKGKNPNVSPSADEPLTGRTPRSIEELSEHFGIERTLISLAAKVHALFAAQPDYKAIMEPRILAEPIGGEHEHARPVGLGAVMAGWAGLKRKGKERLDATYLRLVEKRSGGMFQIFGYWSKLDNQSRTKALDLYRERVSQLSPEESVHAAELTSKLAGLLRARAKGTAA
jgi:hypothetical protein